MIAPYDARALERVRHLHLHARHLAAGLMHGARRSSRVGQAVEFADHAPYMQGDALRDLDWRVLARSDRLVIKRYRAETEMKGTVVLDASADLGSTPEKWETAIRLAATLLTLLHGEGEPAGLLIGAGEGVTQRWYPPRGGRLHLARMFGALATLRPSGRAGLDVMLREIARRLPTRSLVTLVSDFMEEPSSWAPSLAALGRRRVDLRAMQLYDAREFSMDIGGPQQLFSPEGGPLRPLDPDAIRDEFNRERDHFLAEVRGAFTPWRGLWQLVEARGDLVPALGAWMAGRG